MRRAPALVALFGILLLSVGLMAAEAGVTYPQSVPNLVGLTFDQAKAALNSRGLDIAKGSWVPTQDRNLNGKVAKQSHKKGTLCFKRLTVTVNLNTLIVRPSSGGAQDDKGKVDSLRR